MSQRAPSRRNETIRRPETKAFLLTSEFWVAVIAAAAVLFADYVLDDLGNSNAWRFLTWIAIAYIVSRGIAKAGSQRDFQPDPSARTSVSDRRDDGYDYEQRTAQTQADERSMFGDRR